MRHIKAFLKLFFLLGLFTVWACNPMPENYVQEEEAPEIYPDYTGITIPPNIAPLNFRIKNQAENYFVKIENSQGRSVSLMSKSGIIKIGIREWRNLLDEDRGGSLEISTYIKKGSSGWIKLKTVKNEISSDEIDPFIAFRKIPPANILWNDMGIYQRSLETFRETPIMENKLSDDNCMNCHSFNSGNPDQFMFHMRGAYGGTFIWNDESGQLINTKMDHTRAAGVYPSWHPSGDLIAFSVNSISQLFHSRMDKTAFVMDKYSDIVFYDIKDNMIIRPKELSSVQLENMPVWSANGKELLYLCSEAVNEKTPYYSIRYNLMKIDFNAESREFGDRDTLIKSKDFGGSITFPRESPSGKWISFIGVNYGYFSIYNQEADVYFYHKETGEISRPSINSRFTESYPSWSSQGNWLLFVSKRDDGLLSQVWFSHIDENGNAAKPFVLPQEDPGYYNTYVYNYNRPEFIRGKVHLNPRKIYSIARRGSKNAIFDESASVSISTGATKTVRQGDESFYQLN